MIKSRRDYCDEVGHLYREVPGTEIAIAGMWYRTQICARCSEPASSRKEVRRVGSDHMDRFLADSSQGIA